MLRRFLTRVPLSRSIHQINRPVGLHKSKSLLSFARRQSTSASSTSQSSQYATPKNERRSRPPRSNRQSPSPTVYTNTNLRIALIGRPNVGKSTLFNRLAGLVRGRGNDGTANPSPLVFVRSVVDSLPGVTRDPRDASGAVGDLLMTVVDTPGLETAIGESSTLGHVSGIGLAGAIAHCDDPAYRNLYKGMEAKSVQEVRDAQVVFFVIDGGEGITQVDTSIAKWLKSVAQKEVVVIVNKCDVAGSDKNAMEAYSLGFGDPVVVSAEHNLGFAELYTEIDRLHRERRLPLQEALETLASTEEDLIRESFDDELVVGYGPKAGEEPLRQLVVSIIGRPNVGKSTLLNRLVGQERSLVGPHAGVTRDAVLSTWKIPEKFQRKDRIPVWLVDTAGVRAQVKTGEEKLESLSVKTSLRALRHSHVVLMVLDARAPLVSQDMKLLDLIVTEGRAAVLVINKMDTIDPNETDIEQWRLELRYKVDKRISELGGIETVEMSAKNWEDDPSQMRRLFYAVERARSRWEKRISTSALNRFVARFNERMSIGGGVKGERRNRIGVTKFITQKKIRPPMFRLDGSSAVSMNYVRSLTNAIRREFGFEGVPVRVKRPSRRKRR